MPARTAPAGTVAGEACRQGRARRGCDCTAAMFQMRSSSGRSIGVRDTALMVRRSSFDPFAEERRRWPHRISVTNQFSRIVSERKVPAGADLRAEFYAELVRLAREGWT